MDKRILLGIDANFSPATQYAVRAIAELVSQASPTFILLHSISLTQMITEQPGFYMEQQVALTPSPEQRKKAEETLLKARTLLQQQGIAADSIEHLIRTGSAADEIAQVARERGVHLIVIGSQGTAFHHQVRRLFLGSISRRTLQLAPCPVMIVTAPKPPKDRELVPWYEETLKHYLRDHSESLTVLTPQQVAQQFLPPHKKEAGQLEIIAAAKALEHLASAGLLCRHTVSGEVRYVND